MYDLKTHRKMEKILQIRAIWAKKNTIDIKIAQNYYDVKYVECSFMNVQQFFKALKGTMNLKYILCDGKIVCRWCWMYERDIIIIFYSSFIYFIFSTKNRYFNPYLRH